MEGFEAIHRTVLSVIHNDASYSESDNVYRVVAKTNTGLTAVLALCYEGLHKLSKLYPNGYTIELTDGKKFPIIFNSEDRSQGFSYLLTVLKSPVGTTRNVFSIDGNVYNAVMSNLTFKRPKAVLKDSPYKFKLKLLVTAWESGDTKAIINFIESKFKNYLKFVDEDGVQVVYVSRFLPNTKYDDAVWEGKFNLETMMQFAESINTRVSTKTRERQRFVITFNEHSGMECAANYFALSKTMADMNIAKFITQDNLKFKGHECAFADGNVFNCTDDNIIVGEVSPVTTPASTETVLTLNTYTDEVANIIFTVNETPHIPPAIKEKILKLLFSC